MTPPFFEIVEAGGSLGISIVAPCSGSSRTLRAALVAARFRAIVGTLHRVVHPR